MKQPLPLRPILARLVSSQPQRHLCAWVLPTRVACFALFGFVCLFFSGPVWAVSSCDEQMQAQITLDSQRQNQRYLTLGNSGIRPGNEAQIRTGTNGRAVLVLHGFLASPFEVQSVAERLYHEGFTVYSPLIFGFGTTPELANLATMEDFRDSVRQGFSRLRQCYERISIVGMSWGGALASDFVLNDLHGPETESLILLSPYFKAKQWGAETINEWAAKYRRVLPGWVAGLTAPNDHRAAALFPQFHTQGLPLLAVIVALEQSDALPQIDADKVKNGQSIVSAVPTWLATTDADETVSPQFARKFAASHFAHLQVFNYPAQLKIPHQITISQVNPNLESLLNWISTAEH